MSGKISFLANTPYFFCKEKDEGREAILFLSFASPEAKKSFFSSRAKILNYNLDCRPCLRFVGAAAAGPDFSSFLPLTGNGEKEEGIRF